MRSRVLGLRTWIVARISSKAHGCIGPLQANAKSLELQSHTTWELGKSNGSNTKTRALVRSGLRV